MTDLISLKSPESSLSHQLKNQQTLCRQTDGPRIQVPASSIATSSSPSLSSPLSPLSIQLPNRTSPHPVAPSLKCPQQLNNNHSSTRAESDLTLPIPASSFTSSSTPSLLSPSFSVSSPLSPCSTGPQIGGRVSAAISSLYQASASSCSDSSSPSSVPRSGNGTNSHLGRTSPSSRLHLPSVFMTSQIQGSGSSTNRVDQGFAEDTRSSLSHLMGSPQPQHQKQQTEQTHNTQQQRKQTTLLETTQSIPPQSMAFATKSAPLDSSSSSPASSSLSSTCSSSLTTPLPPYSSSTLLLSSSSPVPVPSSPTTPCVSASMPIIAPEKISFTPVVSTTTVEKEEKQQKPQQKQQQQLFHTQLDDRKEKGKEEKEVEEVDMEERNGDIKGENEKRRESDDSDSDNTTTAMLSRTTTTTPATMAMTTTTITSSCDSTSTSASMPSATTTAAEATEAEAAINAGQQAHTACVIPPIGRDSPRYGSLDAAAMNDEDTLLSSLALSGTRLRPMSSMEYAESWLLTTTVPSNIIDSPMTGTAASSRRPSTNTTLETHVSSAFHHSLFRPSSIMVTDQGIAATDAAAANSSNNPCNNGSRRSSDQESVHPLQFDPEPRLSFDGSRQTACSSSSLLSPPFSSATSTDESWLSPPPPSSSSFSADTTSSSSLSSSNNNTSSSEFAQSAPALLSIQTSATQEGSPHKTIRKKTSLASKIRMVFIKPMSNSSSSSASNSNSNGSSNGGGSFSTSKEHDVDVNNNHYHNYHHQTLEDIVSMSSRDGDYDAQGGLLRSSSVGGGSAGELCPPGSHLIEHRGSVSSSSSGESMSVGQGGFSTSSPSTSPEMSPSGSPKPKHALASLIIGPSTAIAGGSIPNRHPLSPVEINHSSNDLTAPLATSCGPKPFEKRMSMEPTSTRTSKKRLSFASITSFFNPRNADAMAASKKKQQRSSSVPNVESPLIVVAGGVAGVAGRPGSSSFQRRHSLNDLETGPQMQAKFAAPPWDKDRVSAQAAAAAAEVMANNASENETSSAAGATTMSKIQGVFGKQSKKNKSKKNKNKKNASHSIDNVPTTATVSTAKPLRSALTHRAVRAPSVRKVQVVHRHQGSVSSTGRRLHQSEPLVNLSQETGVHDSNGGDGSRRSSEEHGRTGPTRHRRQSSITGRQASQHGHYTAVDRKQRVSVRYSSSEEYDIAQHFDLYTPDQHQQQQQQQQQQFQYHGGCIQYDNPAVPQTPRGNPVSTKSMSPQANDPFNHALANISPSTSRGACAEGSFAFSPVGSRRRDSYISCSSGSPSKDTSPKLTFVSTPKQQTHAAVAAAVSNHHRRSSYETNSRRSSMIVTPASPSSVAPVARLSIDHTLMPDHPGPASPSAYPQSTIAAMSPHGHHAIFANHQQQLHYQQQQQQQQFQRHHQMQFLPEQHHHHLHQHQYNHNQQFMTSHAGSQVFHDQYHISSPPQQHQQQQHYQQQQQYQPYPYQYNMQQPMPSHLCYPSVQHPALSYTGVNMSLPPPPPALRYSSSGSGGKRGSNGPSPSTPLRPTRQLHFSTAQHQVHVTWTPDQYDRTSDPNITAHRLTPAIAQKIKLELNTFKSQEMLVHQESRVNTHFFA